MSKKNNSWDREADLSLLRQLFYYKAATLKGLAKLSGVPEGDLREWILNQRTPQSKQKEKVLRVIEILKSLPVPDSQTRWVNEDNPMLQGQIKRERDIQARLITKIARKVPSNYQQQWWKENPQAWVNFLEIYLTLRQFKVIR